MNVLAIHEQILRDYERYIRSFIHIADPEIRKAVDDALTEGKLWPAPLLQFNPAYELAGTVTEAAHDGWLHPSLIEVFKGYTLYRHQLEAIQKGAAGQDFVVTSGTGSGKSLTYIASIFHYLFTNPQAQGVTAIIVYPMNALINSQSNEFHVYQDNYEKSTGRKFPIAFGQYTGQEKEEERKLMREHPPHILLTNYMMLELLLTRSQERPICDAIYDRLCYLVFDELHTYRGRQGADVAMLIRRIRTQCRRHVCHIGTSATMVSAGSPTSQQEMVARFAGLLFGRPFRPEQILSERLTPSIEYSGDPSAPSLADAIHSDIDIRDCEEKLRSHPVVAWLDKHVALMWHGDIPVRRPPQRMEEIVASLAQESGASMEACRNCLANLLSAITAVNRKLLQDGRRSILPFKLHQFISQTGSVYTTLDQGKDRFITLEPGIYKKDDGHRKPIFPNVFSRASGHPFLCITLRGERLEPREFREGSTDEADEIGNDGYLIVGEDIWDPATDTDYLPDAWFRKTRRGRVLESKKAGRFPHKLFFDEYGNCSDSKPLRYWGWFMTEPLLFDPTGGIFFDPKLNEGSKLTKLGNEGRSTSTTIMSCAILHRLDESGCSLRDRKLLSFTDNRQDAALQAGHFNDFLQVIRLRAGIYKALTDAPGHRLNFTDIGEAIFRALDLPFADYANFCGEMEFGGIRRCYERDFQEYLFYLVLEDLRRSWRIILPNLEQCGLLAIEYQDLPQIVQEDTLWADVPIVDRLSHSQRIEFLSTVLDFFRLEFALHSTNLLNPSHLSKRETYFREKLKAPWTLDMNEHFLCPSVLRLDPLHPKSRLSSKSIGPASALGKFLKFTAKRNGIDEGTMHGEDYRRFILQLMGKLRNAAFLHQEMERNAQGESVPVFSLKIEKIVWQLGDGLTVKPDVVKRLSYKDQKEKPNEFFREMYRNPFLRETRLRAEDHTGQLETDVRREREERFRADWYLDEEKKRPDLERIRKEAISALFCSPTMELGIDIGGLSIVHMRNTPPNAANYAQRSGRAGRSGQGALLFTYCSGYSPHDRHFFRQQSDMVSGTVQAPQLDLCNQELLLTHLNALAIGEIGLPGFEQGGGQRPSLLRLVADDSAKMPLAPGVGEGLQLAPTTFAAVKATFRRVIKDFHTDLTSGNHTWYSEDWIDRNLCNLADHLDSALNRWRCLYRAARMLLTRATQPIESGLLHIGSEEYKKYKRQQDQANRQLNLLRNDIGGAGELSEFYPYRYLASEGFLPGYNFTRLPLRIFIPSGETGGEFISRPRAVALREFGPLNQLYHSGKKYKVVQLTVQDAASSLTDAKISLQAGYFLSGEQKDLEICPFSGANLGDNANKKYLHDLLEMSESRAEEVKRITCEEEERVSRGFDLQTYFTVDGGHLDCVRRATVRTGEADLLHLRYIPAARLVHVNSQWRAMKTEGFPIGLSTGNWRSSMPEPVASEREEYRLIKLWTSNLADALYIEPIKALGLEPNGVVTLQYALKRAIESLFQAEPNEIGVFTLGNPQSPNILLYEAAEGSLGILSQFVEKVEIFPDVIREAKRICRFDDPDYRAPASYDDLLSYYNQRDHQKIDRFSIRPALDHLILATIEVQTGAAYVNYEEQYRAMLRGMDLNSSTERVFLDYLYRNGLRLPDEAQKRVEGIYCQPDFYYHPRIWIFCDGSPHDSEEVRRRDEEQRQWIRSRGDEVWVWYYGDDLSAQIARRPDIFRRVR